MFCPKCGNEIEDATKPCPSCGNIADQPASGADEAAPAAEPEKTVVMDDAQAPAAETVEMPAAAGSGPAVDAAASAAASVGSVAAAGAAPEQPAAKKSKAPMIVAAVIAFVVGAAVAALVTWQIAAGSAQGELQKAQSELQQVKAELEEKGGELETAEAELDAAKDELEKLRKQSGSSSTTGQGTTTQSGTTGPDVAEADSAADTGLNAYVGAWQGDLVETAALGLNASNCYGAEKHPLVLTITEVNATGSIKGSAKVLYHNHAKVEGGDVASSDGDEYLDIDGLVGTLSSDGDFTFEKELPGHNAGQKIEIKVETVDNSDGGRVLDVEVTTKSGLGGDVKDTYVLSKSR